MAITMQASLRESEEGSSNRQAELNPMSTIREDNEQVSTDNNSQTSSTRDLPPSTSLAELQTRVELLRELERLESNLGYRPRTHARTDSLDQANPDPRPAKKSIKVRPPPEKDLYVTKDYATYQAFISTQKATAEANDWDENQLLLHAKVYLSSELRDLWESEESHHHREHGWEGMKTFLINLLGDPANRLHGAWSSALRMRPREGESDHLYMHRFFQAQKEIGADFRDINQIWLHVFLESYPWNIRNEVRRQEKFPANIPDLVALITRIKPTLPQQGRQAKTTKDGDNKNTASNTGDKPNNSQSLANRVSKPENSNNKKRFNREKGSKKENPSQNKEKEGHKSDTRDLSEVVCFKCQKKGHLAPDCPNPPAKDDKSK